MKDKVRLLLGSLLVLCLGIAAWQPAAAQSSSCSVDLVPNPLFPIDVDQTEFFQISNNLSQGVKWLKISRGSADFMINGLRATIPNVSETHTDDSITLTSSTAVLPANTFNTIQLTIDVGLFETNPVNWSVQASTSQSGANPIDCGGNLGLSAFGYYPYDTPYRISNVQVSDIKDTSVVITWDSDVPTSSIVYFDQSPDQYFQKTGLDSSLTTSHSVTVTGLQATTGYHFMAAGADSTGRTAYSADGTFLTAATPPPTQIGGGGGTGGQTNLTNSTASIGHKFQSSGDRTAPSVSLSTPLGASHIYKTVPNISGQATDNNSVFAVEYSLDNGANWLPVDQLAGRDTKTASFSFTPANLPDDTYTLLVRAIDQAGNAGLAKTAELIIDQLPPRVGGMVVSVGPQVLYAEDKGQLTAAAGVDEKVTLNAVGGPNKVDIIATGVADRSKSQTFSLTKQADSGLWSGIIGFSDSGTYELTARSADGAGNQTSDSLGRISISPAAKAVQGNSSRPASATATLYSLQNETNGWVEWDAAAYGQQNPQKTDRGGGLSYFLPPGKYYLKVRGNGYKTFTSDIFSVDKPTAFSTTVHLKPGQDFKLGPAGFSWLNFRTSALSLDSRTSPAAKSPLAGKPLKAFSLTDLDGRQVTDLSLQGKPTDLVIMDTWAPGAADQLDALKRLQGNPNLNVLPVSVAQSPATVQAYDDAGGYGLSWLADPDAGAYFGGYSQPTHILVDRNGVVRGVVNGILSAKDISGRLADL